MTEPIAPVKTNYRIGIDLGGTKMIACVFDEAFTPIAKAKKRTKGHEGGSVVIDRLLEVIRAAMAEAGVTNEQIDCIGIGVPGTLDLKTSTVIEAPNIDWFDVPIKRILETEFVTSAVVCNDVDAGVFGEYKFGAGQGGSTVVGVFAGTGVGGGCVIDGKILQGKRRTCMEIGHVPITSDARRDGGGHHGTVEASASRLAISAEIAKAAYRGQAPYIAKQVGTSLTDIRSGVIADAIKNKDEVVEQIVHQAAEHLALAIVGLIHLLAPDIIVLGGGLVEAIPNTFLKPLTRLVKHRVLKSYRDTYEIRPATLGDLSGAIGAAAWAVESLNSKLVTK